MLLLGKVLGGRYELIEKVGVGGMAIVYKARCHLLNRYVAVKILRPELVEDEDFVYRFKRESQSAASLSHHNIVNVYDVGQEGDIYYIVMEFVCGKTLKDFIKEKGRLDSREAIKIGLQIASALEHAHKNGIIHRDIKPQNILIGDDYTAKVADFGIARAVTSATVTLAGSNVIGSVHYFSPEQARGGYIDAKSDLYSLGIVLYEMVTGKIPFEGDTAVSIAIKHIQEKVTPPREINPEVYNSLQAIIVKATEKQPERRYQSAGEMIRDLLRAKKDPEGSFVVSNFNSDAPTRVMRPVDIKNNNPQLPRQRVAKPNPVKANSAARTSASTHKSRLQEIMSQPWAKTALVSTSFILIMFLAFFIGSRIYQGNTPKEVEVPGLTNMTLQDAKDLLKESSLDIETEKEVYNDKIDKGHIISQDPQEGTMLEPDGLVQVVISKGAQPMVVPNVEKMSKREAEIALENAGLIVGETSYTNSEFPNGTVISQSIAPDEEVPRDTEIRLVISKGPEERVVTVGRYTGQELAVAKQMIVQDKLKFGGIKERKHSDTAAEGVVIEQSLKAGETVTEYREISLVVSKGPQPSYPKVLKIDLSDFDDRETINVVVKKVQDGQSSEVYNKFYVVSDDIIKISLTGSGVVDYEIYIDGQLFETKTIDFTKKGSEAD